MPKPARKRLRSPDKDDGPGNKKHRPSSGDGDKILSESTTKPSPNPSTDTSSSLTGVTKSTNPSSIAARNLTDMPSTFTQTAASSFLDHIQQLSATYPSLPIQPPTPTPTHKPSPKDASPVQPSSAQTPPLSIPHPTPPPQGGRKRRPRAKTPPETYTNNLPLVSIVPPIPARAPTGYRHGCAYWLINGVTRLTSPILKSVDALLEEETRDPEADAAWNATLERAVKGVAWRDLLGEPPAHIKEYLRKREREEERKGPGGNVEVATWEDLVNSGEKGDVVKKGGDVDTDDGEAVRRGVRGRRYVDAARPERVAGSLIDGRVVAQPNDPGLETGVTQGEQAGEQSGGSGQASGEAGGKVGAVVQPGAVRQSGLAPKVDPPRNLPGWVDYEARLVDPKYF